MESFGLKLFSKAVLTSKNFWLGGAEVVKWHQVVEHGQLGEVDAVVVGVEEDSLGCAM